MSKINLINNSMAMFMVCEAISGEDDTSFIEPDENGYYDITIQLNGKELDAERFLENLEKSYRQALRKKAADLLSSEYDKMLSEIHDIQATLKLHNRIFSKKVYSYGVSDIIEKDKT